MSAIPDDFIARTTTVQETAIRPFANSRKIYIQGSTLDIQVPMREISQSATTAGVDVAEPNPPI